MQDDLNLRMLEDTFLLDMTHIQEKSKRLVSPAITSDTILNKGKLIHFQRRQLCVIWKYGSLSEGH